MALLSIVLPVYKVEDYIRACLESIFKQGVPDSEFEVILVNDGTPDNSIGVVSDLVNQHENITVINQENQGVSCARNTGLASAKGEYVYFMDPDDMLVDNSLSILIPKAISSKVDVLMADYIKFNDGEDVPSITHAENQDYNARQKSGVDSYLEDLSPYECYIWRMLIRRDFLINNKIDFKPFWYEDTLFCQECLLKAGNCLKVDCQLYFYRLRKGSFTSSMNLNKMLDLNSSLSALLRLKDLEGLPTVAQNRLMDNIFMSFSYGLWCIAHNKQLYAQKEVIISDLKAKVRTSDFWFRSDVKQRFVSFMFWYMPGVYLKMRSLL